MLFLFVGFSTLSAQSPNWSEKCPQTTPDGSGIMAYDSAHGRVVLCTETSSETGAGTWLWDGSNWTQYPVYSPLGRLSTAMAYDTAHGQVVLFGGFTPQQVGHIYVGGTDLNDTWVWDGSAWTLMSPITSPPARSGHAMAYDSTHGEVVLFGGEGTAQLNDTWAWDGVTWTQKSPRDMPSPRSGHCDLRLSSIWTIALRRGRYKRSVWEQFIE